MAFYDFPAGTAVACVWASHITMLKVTHASRPNQDNDITRRERTA